MADDQPYNGEDETPSTPPGASAAAPDSGDEPTTLAREVKSLRNRLEQFASDTSYEFRKAQRRHDAIMEMLKEILSRLPE